MTSYEDERFADIQLLHYRLNGFERLTPKQQQYVYCLSQATLYGRDITFDQFGRYNLRIRKTLEAIYTAPTTDRTGSDFRELETYLKRVWFSSGIYHHYDTGKMQPGFSADYFRQAVRQVGETTPETLPLQEGETAQQLCDALCPVLFDPTVLPKRVNQADGEDLVATSACNYYQNVTQAEAEAYYNQQKARYQGDEPPSFGLNSTLVGTPQGPCEEHWCEDGKYGAAIRRITHWLERAREVAETPQQQEVISALVRYYRSGDLRDFNDYCIRWVECLDGDVDFINGFIEVYGDPLGLKGSWEGLVEYTDPEATRRTRTISDNAQWFEDHSPVDPRFRKPQVKGVMAKAICAAMLGGDEYPATAIGINLPNADWIRARHGSKSITITNITEAYNKAAAGNGFRAEFVDDAETLALLEKYSDRCDELHTDLHECLGHGSGQLLPGTDPDALKAYGNTIEEARADLFGLYYIADPKLVELGLLPDMEAHKAQYYSYVLNGLLTQLIRIQPGHQIEEAHMRNRALIARWCYENGTAIRLEQRDGKTFVRITDYPQLRQLFARLLAEVQRIKSEGDAEAARQLVEQYAVRVDPVLHQELLDRYARLGLAPYKGFVNPVLRPVKGKDGEIDHIEVDYSEGYTQQMLRYSRDYATLI